MKEEIKEAVRISGFKHKYLALRLEITKQYFSMCFNGKKNLSPDKEMKLIILLRPWIANEIG